MNYNESRYGDENRVITNACGGVGVSFVLFGRCRTRSLLIRLLFFSRNKSLKIKDMYGVFPISMKTERLSFIYLILLLHTVNIILLY